MKDIILIMYDDDYCQIILNGHIIYGIQNSWEIGEAISAIFERLSNRNSLPIIKNIDVRDLSIEEQEVFIKEVIDNLKNN